MSSGRQKPPSQRLGDPCEVVDDSGHLFPGLEPHRLQYLDQLDEVDAALPGFQVLHPRLILPELFGQIDLTQPGRFPPLRQELGQRCSGLPVVRHDAASLSAVLGPSFDLLESGNHAHQTSMGTIQRFQFSRFRRSN